MKKAITYIAAFFTPVSQQEVIETFQATKQCRHEAEETVLRANELAQLVRAELEKDAGNNTVGPTMQYGRST